MEKQVKVVVENSQFLFSFFFWFLDKLSTACAKSSSQQSRCLPRLPQGYRWHQHQPRHSQPKTARVGSERKSGQILQSIESGVGDKKISSLLCGRRKGGLRPPLSLIGGQGALRNSCSDWGCLHHRKEGISLPSWAVIACPGATTGAEWGVWRSPQGTLKVRVVFKHGNQCHSLHEVGRVVSKPGRERMKASPLAFPEASIGYGGDGTGPHCCPWPPGRGGK